MIDIRNSGDQIMQRRQSPTAARVSRDALVHEPASTARTPSATTHVTAGNVLWTLTHGNSTAQARRWMTPSGYELELLIWTGSRIEGQEDLCWSQLFQAEDALTDTASIKKQQLEASGWLEDIDTAAR
jgi:hypothetical protein